MIINTEYHRLKIFKLTLITAQIALIPDSILVWDRSHDLEKCFIHIPGNWRRNGGAGEYQGIILKIWVKWWHSMT